MCNFRKSPLRNVLLSSIVAASIVAGWLSGCGRQLNDEVVIYCGVDEPVASPVLDDFERQSGIHVAVRYDIESSKSIGLAGRLEAEKDYPQADIWWGSEAFLSERLAEQDVLAKYQPRPPRRTSPLHSKTPTASGPAPPCGRACWRWRPGEAAPPFRVTGLADLTDPRLKGKVAMSRPTAGATGAHLAAIYAAWGPDKAGAFLRSLHDNGIALLGGNAEVANQVGNGVYSLGLTDSDAIATAQTNGGKLNLVVPDQDGDGGAGDADHCRPGEGIEARATREEVNRLPAQPADRTEAHRRQVREMERPRSAAGDGSFKTMHVDYRAAAEMFPRAQREGTIFLEGRRTD